MSTLAVIDVETTGLMASMNDRIVEIAVVVMQHNGHIIKEFTSLVNPERDIGPTRIHGLTTEDILAAPRFSDIAGELTSILDGCAAIAGHNIRFDMSFLTAEFKRINYPLPETPTICTLQEAGGGKLQKCCADYGISLDGKAHSALVDARAAARLLNVLIQGDPELTETLAQLPKIIWQPLPRSSVTPLLRQDAEQRKQQAPTYLQKLLESLQNDNVAQSNDSTILAYTALLERCLEDRNVDEKESGALIELAVQWGMTENQIMQAHKDFLYRLSSSALANGVVTESERSDLNLVARLLGLGAVNINTVLSEAAEKIKELSQTSAAIQIPSGAEAWVGKRVCFTGECICLRNGRAISREIAEELVTESGLVFAPSVTKKLDALIVADPLSQSGKAKKAREYGIRVVHEPVFWNALGIAVD